MFRQPCPAYRSPALSILYSQYIISLFHVFDFPPNNATFFLRIPQLGISQESFFLLIQHKKALPPETFVQSPTAGLHLFYIAISIPFLNVNRISSFP